MAIYKCSVCETVFDETNEGKKWDQLPGDWICHVCESGKSFWRISDDTPASDSSGSGPEVTSDTESMPEKTFDDFETYMADIRTMAETGESIIEPMRTRQPTFSWDDILIKGAQLAKIPLNREQPVNTKTTIGPAAKNPLTINTPLFITHMSFGALSKEAKLALSKGSSSQKTAMCSGEGGILPESMENAYKYIFEYVPNKYSVSEDNLAKVDAVEIKFGQSAKPGMGGHLPAGKVTKEIANIRGFCALDRQ